MSKLRRMWPLVLQVALAHFPASPVVGTTIQHWELDGTLASEVGGQALVVEPGDAAFEDVAFDDGPARALRVPAFGKVRVPTEIVSDRPGFVDGFSVILDVRFEEGKWLRAPVLQTDADDDDDAEAEVVAGFRGKPATFGAAGNRGGNIVPGKWYRLAMVVDGANGTVTHYVDGQRAAAKRRTVTDSRWSLEPELVLFSDDEKGARPGHVWLSALQVRAAPLDAEAVKALGTASASGITRVEPGGFAFAQADVTVAHARGELVTVRWSAALPAGDAALSLVPDEAGTSSAPITLGVVPLGLGEASVRVPPDIGSGTWRVQARWKDGSALGPRVAVSGLPEDTRALGKELVQNGSFADALEGWVVDGAVSVASQRVVGTHGDYTVLQTIDLAAAGISDALADQGLVVEASALLVRKERAGRFDDRGELFLAFRDGSGALLARLRSLSADAPEWTRRVVRGALPIGARKIDVGIIADERRAPKNEVGADDLQVRIVADATPGLVRLSKQPLLYPSDDPQTLTVLFETDRSDARPELVFAADGQPETRVRPHLGTTVSPRHAVHEARLGPLEPGKLYRYRIEVGPWQSQTWTVKGPVVDGPLRIAWTADNQHGWQTFREMLPAIAAERPDFAVLAGDIVQNGNMLREWQTEWFSTLSISDFGQTTPIWFARGNHDGEHALSYAYTSMPGNQAWYAVTRGGARFIVLDTEAEHGPIPEQLAWLRGELASPASRNADFRIVTFHKTPFSNRWSSKISKYDGEDWVRQFWVPLFDQFGVDLVIAGHAHAYQRMDQKGVRYLVVGGAGGWLDKFPTARWPMDKDLVVHHWALMELGDQKIVWTAKDEHGEVIDHFTMRAKRTKAARSP